MEFTTATFIELTKCSSIPSPLTATKNCARYFQLINGVPMINDGEGVRPVMTNDFGKVMQFLEQEGMTIH